MPDYLGYERAFKNFGINYTVEPGAYERGHGDIREVRFLVIHHTAGGNDAGDIRIVRDGRAGLPGPLSQLCLKRNGDPHIVAVGVCWHAPGSINYRGVPAGSGNYYSIGIEGISNGYDDWTPAQRANYPRVVAALLKDLNLPSDAFIFHRDYQPREKIDPGGFTRAWFQAEVNRHYNAGSAPLPPKKTAIQQKREESPWLGNKVSDGEEIVLPDKIGRATFYQNGAIYWSPTTGAQALSKEMLERYASQGYELGVLKYPVNSVVDVTNGRAQAFQGGSIYWSEKEGAHFVGGAIGSKWAETGWEKGSLGFPVTDEIVLPDGKGILQAYQGGHIYYHPDTGAKVISGAIWDRFSKEGYEQIVGYPKTDAFALPARPGSVQIFTGGHIYDAIQGKSPVFVPSDFMYYYERLGYESGRLGLPIGTRNNVSGDTWTQAFEGGSITIDRKSKEAALSINGNIVAI